jgi:hypothetical protein
MIYGALNMFLNYDGSGARFGPTSVRATTSAIQSTAVYASDGAPGGRIVIVAINRSSSALKARINVIHDQILHHVRIYELGSDGTIHVITDADGKIGYVTLPPMSVYTIALDP